jgi:arginase
MGVAHMLGEPDGVAELVAVAGPAPMLAPERLAFLGLAPVSEHERKAIDRLGPAVVDLPATIADPEAAAQRALAALDGCEEIAVHFDVDVLDFLDAPLAENSDHAPALPLASAGRALAALLADARVTALTVTEFNPHHGAPDGATTRRLAGAIAGAFAG